LQETQSKEFSVAAKKNVQVIPLLVFVAFVFVVGINIFNDETQTAESGNSEIVPEANRPFSGPGYILEFASDYNPGLAQIDDLGISIVIAVDTSGSMSDLPQSGGSNPKYIEASRSLSEIVNFLEGLAHDYQKSGGLKLKVAVITFHSEVDVLYPLTEMKPESFAQLRLVMGSADNFEPGGKTAIGKTIEKATEILSQSGTILKSMIVISDGENTEGPEPADVLYAVNENRNNVTTVEYPVDTRGVLASFVGFDIDSGAFSPLADLGARVSSAADKAQLTTSLQEIFVADITKLEAGTSSE